MVEETSCEISNLLPFKSAYGGVKSKSYKIFTKNLVTLHSFFLYRIQFMRIQHLLNLEVISLSNKNTGILLLGLKLQQLTISTSQLR